MARPPIPRTVRCSPGAVYYKPRGIPLSLLEEIVLGLDEVEALRLGDFEGLEQEAVGRLMNISRPTVGRILAAARRKVAEALVTGKALRLEGGPAHLVPDAWLYGGGGGRGFGGGHGRGRCGRGRGGGGGGPGQP
jgi:predicted DNA-binding protein (UPF0251 family)